MKPSCPRLFEVEAARDGRLTGSDLAHFKTHVSHCPSCANQARALDTLADSLRSLPAVASDDLQLRRERTRLLAAFNAALVPVPVGTKRWLLPLVAAAFVTTLGLMLWHSASPHSASVATLPREAITIQAAPEARWSRLVEGHRETITLSSGTLSIAIDHDLSPRRIRVLLPDGELEDLGTTFTVTATSTATSHVSVQDGAVILRLRDRPPLVVGANESWTPHAPARSLSAPATDTASPPVPAPRARASASAPAPAAAPVPNPEPAPTTDPASDFRAALTALNAGNDALAAELFRAFLARYPSAPNAEDAAYLRVIALQRAGNTGVLRSAAREFLQRYPTAFRRSEVEPLAQ